MTTFVDIGLNFPLFQAPIIAADVDGRGSCIVCNKIVKILFAKACFEYFCAGRVDHAIDAAGQTGGYKTWENTWGST